jgi:hypothetical protein
LRDLAVENRQIFSQPVEFAQMPVDSRPFVIGDDLLRQPDPPESAEQLSMRAGRDQMGMQDCVHLVLNPRAVTDDLVASRHEPPQPLGLGVGQPDLRQKVGGPQRGQNSGVDLVGLDVGVSDRLDLQRVGDDHAADIGGQHADHRHRIAGRLDNDLVLLAEAAAKAFQPGTGHTDASGRTQLSRFPEHHLGKGSVDVHADHASHHLLLLRCVQWEQWATRQLRIRALGATG